MFNVLLDTSVWLGLAENPKQTPLLDVLVTLLSGGRMNLLVPRTVLAEFQANKTRVATASAKSLSSHFDVVKEAVKRAGGEQREKVKVLDYLADVDHRIPILGGVAESTLKRIETILKVATPIEASTEIKARAADRALSRKGPCHRDRNSVADAVLIETYFECVRNGNAGDRFAFVTHNFKDFSQVNGNNKQPHADIASGFTKIRSLYFISFADCLRRIDPYMDTDLRYIDEYEFQPRGLTELLKAQDRLATQVWHNRHMNLQWEIDHGRHKIVSKAEWNANEHRKGYGQRHTVEDIWAGAKRARKKAERQLGEGNYGPYSHFECGIVNGKLSAVRWMLGEDWDMLDT